MSSDATARDVNLELRARVYRGDLDAVRRSLDDGANATDTFTITNLPFLSNSAIEKFEMEEDEPMTILTLWRKSGPRKAYRYTPQSETRIAILRLLLEHGADATDGSDENPLHHACFVGDLPAARLFLDHGADANGSRYYYSAYRPVIAAARRNHVDVLSLLIDRGAALGLSPEVRYGSEGTPLGTACVWGHVHAVRLLLDRGADINLKDHSREPPLFHALRSGKVDVVRLLLARGADIEGIIDVHPIQNASGTPGRDPVAWFEPMSAVTLARTRGCLILQGYPSRAAHMNAAFDLFFLARCVVAGQRAAHRGSERQRVWFDRNLVEVIATYLVVKTPLEHLR